MAESPKTVRPSPKVAPHRDINWDAIDWNLSDQRIADILGVNKAHVNLARHTLNKPQATHHKVEARRSFRRFLMQKKGEATRQALPKLIAASGICISPSAAYRVALSLRVRGQRQNKSQYDDFWCQVNWKLPDSDLATLWDVARGNIQMKRKMMVARETPGVPERPQWTRMEFATDRAYRRAYRAEMRKAEAYDGPRPS